MHAPSAAKSVSVAGLEPRFVKIIAKYGGLRSVWRARNYDAYWKTIFRLSAVSSGYCRAGVVVFRVTSLRREQTTWRPHQMCGPAIDGT